MGEIFLSELVDGLAGVRIIGRFDEDVVVCDMTEDSRAVRAGTLFVARRGERFDGRAFIGDAIERGAVAVMVEGGVESDGEGFRGCVLVEVADLRFVLGEIAERFFGRPTDRLKLIGITGTNGKTTTAHLIHQMLNGAGKKCGLIGTVYVDDGSGMRESALTTPMSIELSRLLGQMVANGCEYGVMEVSSHALVQGRVSGKRFCGAVFTNLSGDHLDYHGTMAAYGEAKGRLFAMVGGGEGGGGSWVVVNRDDSASGGMVNRCGGWVSVVGVGMDYEGEDAGTSDVDWSVAIEEVGIDGMGLVIQRGREGVNRVHTRLAGAHNAMNVAEACAVVSECGIGFDEVCELAGGCVAPPGRLERVMIDDEGGEVGFAVLVDYAHTDDALRNVLGSVRSMLLNRVGDGVDGEREGGRLIVVFGCGGDRDRTKRPRMMRAACEFADVVMVTSDNPRTEDAEGIVEEIVAGVDAGKRARMMKEGRLFVEVDRREAIEKVIVEVSRAGDVVVIAGKGHEDYQIVGREKRTFDDRVVSGEALAVRASGGGRGSEKEGGAPSADRF